MVEGNFGYTFNIIELCSDRRHWFQVDDFLKINIDCFLQFYVIFLEIMMVEDCLLTNCKLTII